MKNSKASRSWPDGSLTPLEEVKSHREHIFRVSHFKTTIYRVRLGILCHKCSEGGGFKKPAAQSMRRKEEEKGAPSCGWWLASPSSLFFSSCCCCCSAGVFIKYEGRWRVVAPKKVRTDAQTDRQTDRTNNLYNGGPPPITQRTKYTPLGKEGIEQSSPPPRGN